MTAHRDPTASAVVGDDSRPVVHCGSCDAVGDKDRDGYPPAGWYRVQFEGRFDKARDVAGRFCSLECLIVAALGRYQLSEDVVRCWLAGPA
jgi:hypothetical protein